jgi:hypothetical protein
MGLLQWLFGQGKGKEKTSYDDVREEEQVAKQEQKEEQKFVQKKVTEEKEEIAAEQEAARIAQACVLLADKLRTPITQASQHELQQYLHSVHQHLLTLLDHVKQGKRAEEESEKNVQDNMRAASMLREKNDAILASFAKIENPTWRNELVSIMQKMKWKCDEIYPQVERIAQQWLPKLKQILQQQQQLMSQFTQIAARLEESVRQGDNARALAEDKNLATYIQQWRAYNAEVVRSNDEILQHDKVIETFMQDIETLGKQAEVVWLRIQQELEEKSREAEQEALKAAA